MKDVLKLAIEDIGTWEWKDGHNPKVLQYFVDAGHPGILDDETAWCAAFVGAMLQRCGYKPTGSLLARSYETWGEPVAIEDAQPGDIMVKPRGNYSWQGHVFFFVARNSDGTVQGLGGNQRNQVNIQDFKASEIIAVRRGKPMRTSKAQSTTLQATGVSAGALCTAGGSAIAGLDGTAQVVAVVAVAVGLLGLAWIARRRIKRWVEEDR